MGVVVVVVVAVAVVVDKYRSFLVPVPTPLFVVVRLVAASPRDSLLFTHSTGSRLLSSSCPFKDVSSQNHGFG